MAGKREPVKIGLFGIGLETYWDQFEGLFEKLKSYQTIISEKIKSFGVELIDAGMVDNPEKAQKAANFLKTQDVEILFLYVSTYALSSTVLPIAQKLKVPIIILNLQPVAQLDYNKFNALNDRGIKTGIWLEHCQACSVPEIANVFIRSGINYEIVTGFLNDKEAWEEIKCWTDAAKVAHAIRNNRMGILGHYYGGMLDVYTDLTKLSSTFGTHFEILEMCELKKLRDLVSEKEIETKISEFNSVFEIVPDCVENEIIRAAQTSVALDYLVKNHN
ncbi:MAG: arabinose isomerase, partial [Prolixibacteraceae bacterium]|nr:arabinose isomerase [Prolixibacteraceae bacterium]